jgi:hypothetical protein
MHTYEDLGWRTPAVVVCVSLNAVIGLATTALGAGFDENHPDLLVAALIVPGFLGSLGTFLLSIVAVGVWTHRACANGHALGSRGDWVTPSVSPAMAVGSYFIPFVNLVRPYQAMREIDSATLGHSSTDPLLGLWWATWIVGNVLANAAFRLDSPSLDLAGAAVHLVSGITLVLVVRRMHASQSARDEELRRAAAPSAATFRDAPEPKLEP